MISDHRAAEICSELYGQPTETPVVLANYDSGSDDGVVWGLVREAGVAVVCFRGSQDLQDWIRDIFAIPFRDRELGPVHHGFYLGMRNVWADLQKLLDPNEPVVLTGHSLGAARASILAGIMMLSGRAPLARIVFGEPKSGFAALASLIKDIPSRSYRTGDDAHHDIVTDLPLSTDFFNYVRATPFTILRPDAALVDASPVFGYHHMPIYLEALKRGLTNV